MAPPEEGPWWDREEYARYLAGMPIRWDPLLIRHLAEELDAALGGARLRGLRLDGEARDLLLFFRERTLVWRLHPTRGWLTLHEPTEPTVRDLRLPARVRRVRAPADERIVVVELLPVRPAAHAHDLVVELLGNQWNAMVVERPGGTVRHVLTTRTGARPLAVGREYRPPAAAGRRGMRGDLDASEWAGLLADAPGADAARVLVRNVAWTSPLVAPALVPPAATLESGHALWRRLARGEEGVSPVVIPAAHGAQPYPFALPGLEGSAAGSLLEAFSCAAREDGSTASTPESVLIDPDLLGRLERALDHLERRAGALRAELDSLGEAAPLRALGDLILARFGDVPVGVASAVLTGFDGEPVRVSLDPALTVHGNAERHYDEAARIERARARLPGLIGRAQHEVERVRTLLERARAGNAGAEEIRATLPAAPTAEARTPEQPTLPYRVFRSSGGLEIRVGRGARHNDDLTLHHSAPDDVWLHARHAAGAHVVLRWRGPGNPPARDLHEAAVLAALHSKARTSGSAPVDWTRRKYVRKPRGSPPGRVVAERLQTLFVAPDPGLLEALAEA